MSESRIYRIEELEFPVELYPRASGKTWWLHVLRYADEMRAGSQFPPILVGIFRKRKIVVDGWHRCQALKLNKEEYVTAITKNYPNFKEIFADAVRYNNHHGIMLTPRDKSRIIAKLEDMTFTPFEIGEIVKATPETLHRLSNRKVTTPRGTYYLKSPLIKLKDKGWIDDDIATKVDQSIISVQSVTQLINQLINFIDGDAFPWEDPNLGTSLAQLYDSLKTRFAPIMEAKTS